MNYPEFYNDVKNIEMVDPLSHILGSINEGKVSFSYLEIVKTAGHSCPTVGGAYLMTYRALETLYGKDFPVRGEIKVEFKESIEEGVAGVIGNVISNITGATEISGFKGLNGKFVRHSLMTFNSNIDASVRFTRVDTNKSVDVYYDPSSVQPHHKVQPLMQKIMMGTATVDEKNEFAILWQKRVKEILIDNCNNDEVLRVVELS